MRPQDAIHWRLPTRMIAIAALFCMAFIGCNDDRPERVPVSGTVMIDGQPATSGSIQFLSQGGTGRPSMAKIEPDGSFQVFTFAKDDGCPQGTFDVLVSSIEELGETAVRYNLPKKYGDRSTSGIVKTVEGPTDAMLIELTWDGIKGPVVEQTQ